MINPMRPEGFLDRQGRRVADFTGTPHAYGRAVVTHFLLLAGFLALCTVVICIVNMVTTWNQTVSLERYQDAQRPGYVRRTNAIIANHATIIHNETILCKAAGRTDCISAVARP